MNAPTWMVDWRKALLATATKVTIDLEPFRTTRKPRPSPGTASEVLAAAKAPRPALVATVQEAVTGTGLEAGFRVDVFRDDELVRSYAIVWESSLGTFMASQCTLRATKVSVEDGWTVSVQLDAEQQRGQIDVVYRAMYDHLLDGGHKLPEDQFARIRLVNRTLSGLGLTLSTTGDDPRCRPVIVRPGQAAEVMLKQLVSVLVARQVLSGLMGSAHRAVDARRLLDLSEQEFDVFAQIYGWGDESHDERPLESELCRRFGAWVGKRSPELDLKFEERELEVELDGQRPDIALRRAPETLLVEAKLGLTRDSVRTGLTQAAEYSFHLPRASVDAPVLLLLGEPPEFHGPAFAMFVEQTARHLGVGVFVERVGAVPFTPWPTPGAVFAAVQRPGHQIVGDLLRLE